jgi:hypothetical protein
MSLHSPTRQTTFSLAERFYLAAKANLPTTASISRPTAKCQAEESPASDATRSVPVSLCSEKRASTLTNASQSGNMNLSSHMDEDDIASYYEDDTIHRPPPLRLDKRHSAICSLPSSVSQVSLPSSISRSSLPIANSRYSLSAQDPFGEFVGPLAKQLEGYALDRPISIIDSDGSTVFEVEQHEIVPDPESLSDVEEPASPMTPTHHLSTKSFGAREYSRYHEHLQDFTGMLEKHLSSLHEQQLRKPQEPPMPDITTSLLNVPSILINSRPSSRDSQDEWRNSTADWSAKRTSMIRKSKELSAATKEEKKEMRRKRMQHWRDAHKCGDLRFNSAKYQQLCTTALAELYDS